MPILWLKLLRERQPLFYLVNSSASVLNVLTINKRVSKELQWTYPFLRKNFFLCPFQNWGSGSLVAVWLANVAPPGWRLCRGNCHFSSRTVPAKAASSPSLQKDFTSNPASTRWFWSQIPEGLGKGRIQKEQKCHPRGYNPDDDHSRQYAAQGIRKNTCFSKILSVALFWRVFSLHVFCWVAA